MVNFEVLRSQTAYMRCLDDDLRDCEHTWETKVVKEDGLSEYDQPYCPECGSPGEEEDRV